MADAKKTSKENTSGETDQNAAVRPGPIVEVAVGGLCPPTLGGQRRKATIHNIR